MRSRVGERRPRFLVADSILQIKLRVLAPSTYALSVWRIRYMFCTFSVQNHMDIRGRFAHKLTDHRIILDESRTCAIIVGMSRIWAASSETMIVGEKIPDPVCSKKLE